MYIYVHIYIYVYIISIAILISNIWNSMDLFSFRAKNSEIGQRVLLIFDFLVPQTNGLSSGPRVSGKVMDIKQMKQECEQARKHNKAVQSFYFWFNRNQIEPKNFFFEDSLGQFYPSLHFRDVFKFFGYPWRRCCYGVLSVSWGCLRAADLFCVLSVSCCSLAVFIVMVSTFRLVFFSLWPCRLPHQSKSHENPASNLVKKSKPYGTMVIQLTLCSTTKRFCCWKKVLIKWGNSELHV